MACVTALGAGKSNLSLISKSKDIPALASIFLDMKSKEVLKEFLIHLAIMCKHFEL
jgi:hypothetical protein